VLVGGALATPALVAVAVMAVIVVLFVGTRWALVVTTMSLLVLQGAAATLGGRHVDTRFRSYFGSYRIVEDGPVRVILSGTTMHGMQRARPRRTTEMLSYYGATSGVAAAFSATNAIEGRGMRVGVIGLGAGMLACYARPGQEWTFFEIDPTVVAVARDPSRFSFLSECTPRARIVEGDARLAIEAMPEGSLDLLVVDAFSSDAIPLHLVTREAFDAYSRVVGPDGIVIAHISNRHLDLEPVMAALADWHPRLIRDKPTAPLMQPSTWVVLSRNASLADRIAAGDRRWTTPRGRPGFAGWTDARASIVPFIKF
jgi:spermidine synthase